MQHVEPGPTTPTVDLFKEAILDTRELVETEVSLAKNEIREELQRSKRAGIVMSVAAAAALVGLTMIVVAIALAIQLGPLPALIFGLGFLVVAAIGFVLGYNRVPKQPLPRTRTRLETDVRILKEHLV